MDRKVYISASLFDITRQLSFVTPISHPYDRFFYAHHTPMKDTYTHFQLLGIMLIETVPDTVGEFD